MIVDSVEEFTGVQVETLADAQEIDLLFSGGDFRLHVSLYRSKSPTEPAAFEMYSYFSVSGTNTDRFFIFKALADEFQETFGFNAHTDCSFISTFKDDSSPTSTLQLVEKAKLEMAPTSKPAQSIFTGSVRTTNRILTTETALNELVTLFISFDLTVSVKVELTTGETRTIPNYRSDPILESEWKDLRQISVLGSLPQDIQGEYILIQEERDEPGRFSLGSRSKDLLEERRQRLVAFSSRFKNEEAPEGLSDDKPEFLTEVPKKGKVGAVALITVACLAIGTYLSTKQTISSGTQADNSKSQTSILSHSDQAKLVFTRTAEPGKAAHEFISHFALRNIGKSSAANIILQCWGADRAPYGLDNEGSEWHGVTIPFNPLAVNQAETVSFPVDLDRTNRVRDGERRCLSGPVYASYKDDGGEHYIGFDENGNPGPELKHK